MLTGRNLLEAELFEDVFMLFELIEPPGFDVAEGIEACMGVPVFTTLAAVAALLLPPPLLDPDGLESLCALLLFVCDVDRLDWP